MVKPVKESQNIFWAQPTVHVHKHSGKLSRDTLQMQEASIFSRITECFTQFFQAIYNLFFGSTAPALSTKDKIQEIAARDHFVWFYKKEENPLTAFMGNFHSCPIRLWGLQFRCAEAAFQAAKFTGNPAAMQQFQNLDGEMAFRKAQALTGTWDQRQKNAWYHRNLNVMREVVTAKFQQNPELKDLLLATGNSYLVEHIPRKGRDAFWGDDFDGTGQNWLGHILMETRGQLGGSGVVSKPQQYNRFVS